VTVGDLLAVAVIPSRHRRGVWLVGACCRHAETTLLLDPPEPMRGSDAEWLALHDHAVRCGWCDLGSVRASILAERNN